MVTTNYQGSKLQKAIEKSVPAIRQRRERFERIFKGTRLVGGGGGGSSTPPPMSVDEAKASSEAAEKARIQQEDLKLRREMTKSMKEAQTEYRTKLRDITSKAEKQKALEGMYQKISAAEARYKTSKVEAGIIAAATVGGVRITKDTAASYGKAVSGEPLTQEEVKRLEGAGVKFEKAKETKVPEFYVLKKREGVKEYAVPQKYTVGGEPYSPKYQIDERDISFLDVVKTPKAAIEEISQDIGKVTTGVLTYAGYKGLPTREKKIVTKTYTIPKDQKYFKEDVKFSTEEFVGYKSSRIASPESVGKGVAIGVTIGGYVAAPTWVIAPAFVASGGEKLFAKDTTTEEKLWGAAEAGLGGAMIGGKIVRYARQPVVIKTPLRAVKTPKAYELRDPITINSKPGFKSKYTIVSEVKPPMKVEVTTKWRQVTGKPPLAVSIAKEPVISYKPTTKGGKNVLEISIKAEPGKAIERTTEFRKYIGSKPKEIYQAEAARFGVTETPYSILGKEPFITTQLQRGRRFATLSKVESYGYQTIKRGKSVIEKAIIKETKLARVTPGKRKVYVRLARKPGKMISRYETITAVKPTPILETPTIKIQEAKTLYMRDVSVPKLKAGIKRKPGELDTTIVTFKTPPQEYFIPKVEPPIKIYKSTAVTPAKIPKTPLSITFPKVPKVIQEEVPIVSPKPPPLKVPKIDMIPEISYPEGVSILTGTSIPASAYAGMGTYEVSKIGAVRLPLVVSQVQDVKVDVIPAQVIKPELKTKLEQKYIPKLSTEVKIIPKIMVKTAPREKVKVETKVAVKPALRMKQKLALKMKQQILSKIAQKQLPKPKIPKILITAKPFPAGTQKPVFKLGDSSKEDYELFIRRYQKWKKAGELETLKAAVKKGVGIVKGTLAASLKIMKGSKLVSRVKLPSEFRPAKREAGVWVQKRKFRLSTKGETTEILKSKRTKGRKQKWL